MGIKYRQEDEADKWLREHDPYYTDSRKNKRKYLILMIPLSKSIGDLR